MKAIVTGATGFVGSNLCEALMKKGFEVSVITRTKSDLSNLINIKDKLEIFEYKNDIDSLINFFNEVNADVVFHLAAVFISDHKETDIDNLISSNITFGLNILEAMRKSNTKIIINTGTSWQYYHSNEYNPANLYAGTKEAFECLMRYYVDAESIRSITLKLFDTYGEKDTRQKLINLLSTFSRENKELNMSPGEQMLDLVYIDDVTDAFIKAFEYISENEEIKFEEYGVGSKKPIKLKHLVDTFEKISGQKLNIIWGGREYRNREVMKVWLDYNILPNWNVTVDIEEGLRKIIKFNDEK